MNSNSYPSIIKSMQKHLLDTDHADITAFIVDYKILVARGVTVDHDTLIRECLTHTPDNRKCDILRYLVDLMHYVHVSASMPVSMPVDEAPVYIDTVPMPLFMLQYIHFSSVVLNER